jgi:D-alanyl-D-alanine dipeptidase
MFLRALLLIIAFAATNSLPEGFVYIKDVDASIIEEIRYFTNHNFIGRPIKGYKKAECILSTQAAASLTKVQQMSLTLGYTLKVWDCYRP